MRTCACTRAQGVRRRVMDWVVFKAVTRAPDQCWRAAPNSRVAAWTPSAVAARLGARALAVRTHRAAGRAPACDRHPASPCVGARPAPRAGAALRRAAWARAGAEGITARVRGGQRPACSHPMQRPAGPSGRAGAPRAAHAPPPQGVCRAVRAGAACAGEWEGVRRRPPGGRACSAGAQRGGSLQGRERVEARVQTPQVVVRAGGRSLIVQ
ncbi:MAG: hypothetical protein J3K34DRAFT_127129 [Monoraphidium minutum]|nr:MAG: hypothetical protein J3K34DRAFT_127129 [Monoraphidium minutum]